MMKVKELLEQLKNADPEIEIEFKILEGCCGDYDELDDPEIDVTAVGDWTWKDGRVVFEFAPLWFFNTCITSGKVRKVAKEFKQSLYGDEWKPGMPNKKIDYHIEEV